MLAVFILRFITIHLCSDALPDIRGRLAKLPNAPSYGATQFGKLSRAEYN